MDISKVKLLKAQDLGEDILYIEGNIDGFEESFTDAVDTGEKNEKEEPVYKFETKTTPILLTAKGWVSALKNFYPADAYGENGHVKIDAKPREMTLEEKQEYCKKLLLEQNQKQEEEKVEPIDLKIV